MKADAQDSKNLFDVRKKVAFVTGASSGLGRHAANVLARSGASVVGIARRQEKLQDWVEENEGRSPVRPMILVMKHSLRGLQKKS